MPMTTESFWHRRRAIVVLGAAVLWLGLIGGCAKSGQRPTAAPPLPTYTGPVFMRGCVGSLTTIRGDQPLAVSGFGLVVNLRGTGSAEVPSYMRQWLINEMRKQGVGDVEYRKLTGGQGPAAMLASRNTAVVRIRGLIPPGATKDMRFDVVVEALDQTQTTSLEAGQLWTFPLAINGADPQMRFHRPLANAKGPIYINPLRSDVRDDGTAVQHRRAVVLSGGRVTQSRRIELLLNQPSASRARAIGDRINERFGHEAASRVFNTAVPLNQQIIRINTPRRFGGQPEALLELIRNLFVQRGANFETQKAGELADVIVRQPTYSRQIVLAWHALGRTILPVLIPLYQHTDRRVQLAALEAGSRLGDEKASAHLARIAQSPFPSDRREAGRILRYLPNSMRGAACLARLVNDADPTVRIAAYESMAAINDPNLLRVVFGQKDQFKFVFDMVPSDRPMIYITGDRLPRLVLFGDKLSFKRPTLARFWDNRLIVRAGEDDLLATVFYQPPGQIKGDVYKIGTLVANFVYLMAHEPTVEEPTDGLNLSYSDVVAAVYQMCRDGQIEAEVEIERSPLEAAVARLEQTPSTAYRPETAGDADESRTPAATTGYVPLNVNEQPPPDHADPTTVPPAGSAKP